MSSKARSSRPPDPSVVNQAWFTNLQLLGFDSAAMSAQYSIPFNRDMFNLPNKKGYEVVMHFLFSKLNINMCRELFRDCWPVRDKKTETFFSRTVNRWMTDISKEEPEANLPRVVMSLFLSPGREKFCHLLFHFSSFVLKQCIKHDNGVKEREMLKRPVLTPHTVNLGRVVGKAVQCSAVRHRKRFLETAQENVIAQRQWREYASELVKDYRRLSKRIRELEHQLRDAQQKCADMGLARGSPMPPRRKSHSSEFDLKAQAIKRAQRVQKVRAMWQSVEDFTSGQSAEREVVESIFQSSANKFRIDSRDIDIKVPELLLRECEQEIQRRQVENTYEGGKINLLSLIQLWNLSLHLYIEKLHEAGVPQMELAPISTQVHTHHSHLTNAKSLRSQLSKEVIPDLQSSIDQLQATVSDTMLNYTSPANQRSVAFKFELLEPTPPISFTPGSETTPDQFSSKVTPEQDMGTPDAVGKLTDAVTKASRKTKLFEGDPSLKSPGVYSTASGHTINRTRVYQTRLPTRTETKPRRKVASGPSQHSHHTPTVKSIQARSEVNGRSQGAEPRRRAVSGGAALHHNGMPSRETTLEGRDLYYSSHPQNQTLLDSSVQPRSPLERGSANTPRKTTTPSRHPLSEASELLSHTPAKTATPRAHEILADKIADAVIRGSPFLDSYSKESGENTPRTLTPDFNLENPMEALDTEAFISRDLIGRSPHDTVITDHRNIHQSPNASLHKSHNESQEIYVVSKEVEDNDKVEITDIVAKDLDVLSEDNYAEVDNLDSSTLIPRNSHHGLKSRTDFHKLSSPREVTDLKLSPLVPISPRERQSEIPPFSLSNSFGKSPIIEPQTGNIAAEVQSAKSKVKSQSLTSNRLLDSSDIVTQLQIDADDFEQIVDVKDVVSGTPTVTIDAKMREIFKTATPTLSRSKKAGTDNSSNVVYEIFSEKKNTPVTSRLKLSEDFDGDIFSISPPDLQLNEIDGNLLSKLSSPVLNHFTQTLSPKESLHRSTKSARQNFKPIPTDFTLSPFQMLENSAGVKLKEVFSEDSLNSEDKRTPLDTSPDLPGMRTQQKKSVESPRHTESLNESYAPVEEGLQISSPFKTKPQESLPTSVNKVSSSAMDDLISKYKRLRQATFAEVPSMKEGEKTPLNKTSTSTEHVQGTPRSRQGEVQTVFQKDLFSLDLEDLDFNDKENEGVQKSPDRLKSNSSALNFFPDEDNSFLVPTSPLL